MLNLATSHLKLKKLLLKTKKIHFLLFLILSLFPLLIIHTNIIGILNNCFEAYDFGLYQQIIYNYAKATSINPYISVRDLGAMNDHFTPIIFLAIPIVLIFNFHPVSLIIFEWFWFIILIFLTIKLNIKRSSKELLFILFMLIFTKGILTALIFPIHPGTWAMVPLFLLPYFLYRNNFKGILLTALSLILFRESFQFAILIFSLGYLINKEYKKTLAIFIPTILLIIFTFHIRPLIFGATYDYGGEIINPLLKEPIKTILNAFSIFSYKTAFKLFFPFFIPLFFLFKEVKDWSFIKGPGFKLFLFYIPLFALHFLANKFHYHYGPTFTVPLLGAVIFSGVAFTLTKNKHLLFLIPILFVISASSTYTRFFRLGILLKTNKCIISKEKRAATLKIKHYVHKNIKNDEFIFTNSRVIPAIMKAKMSVFLPHMYTKARKSFDYLLLEKNFNGHLDSITLNRFNRYYKNCVTDTTKILINNLYYFLLKGPIINKCYDSHLGI